MDKIDKYIKNRACGINNIDALCSILNFILQYRLLEEDNNICVNDLIQYSNISDDMRYTIFKIPKKRADEYRIITAPNNRLKSILKAVNILLSQTYDSKPYVTGFVLGSSVVKNATLHTHQKFVFNIDLHNFFGTIYFNNIVEKLKSEPYNYSTEVAEVIAGLSSVKDHKSGAIVLAQGSPASPIISNIMCKSLDDRLNELSQRYKVRYSRYADDITFSGRKNIFNYNGKFIRGINAIIEGCGFVVNFNKVRLQHKDERQVVTGLTVNNKVNVSRFYIKDIRNILYIWERYGYKDAYSCFARHYNATNPKANNIPSIIGYLYGKLSFLRLVKGENDSTYKKLFIKLQKLASGAHYNFRSKTLYDFCTFIKAIQLSDIEWNTPNYNKYGIMYYNSPKGLIIVSPIIKEIASSLKDTSTYDFLESYCCAHKIYDKDGVKWLLSLRNDMIHELNAKKSNKEQEQTQNNGHSDNDINILAKATLDDSISIKLYPYLVIAEHFFDGDFGFMSLHEYFYCKTLAYAKQAMNDYFQSKCHVKFKLESITEERLLLGIEYRRFDDYSHSCKLIKR